MRIGIPRALMYHYYYPLWRTIFENLGFDVVVSEKTSKIMVTKGIKVTVPEICLPIKIFNAHVINLLEEGVDYVFVPRLVSLERGLWCCPKYIGLVELVKNTALVGNENKLLSVYIDVNDENVGALKCYLPLCEVLNVTKAQMRRAVKSGNEMFAKFRECCRQGYTIEEADKIIYDQIKPEAVSKQDAKISIGLLGYVYNVYDSFVSMDTIKKLRSMGVRVYTFEMFDEKMLRSLRDPKQKTLFWTFTDKIYETAKYLLSNDMVDGLIHITAFGCGPDSIVGKMLELDFEKYHKPFMTLRVDEHTGEGHLVTRLEAFVDMIKRKVDNV